MCPERLDLLAAYDDAVEEYARSTTDLGIAVKGECGKEDFDKLYALAHSKLISLREAKLALWEHREQHKC